MNDEVLSISVNGLADLPKAAQQLIDFAGNQHIWIFDGEMGAGKTTFITTICHELGVEDEISSPTFSIVNEYQNKKGEQFYHFDFYRLQDEFEAMDIGLEEYLDTGNICFIEWASKVAGLLPDEFLHIHIELISKSERKIHIKHIY